MCVIQKCGRRRASSRFVTRHGKYVLETKNTSGYMPAFDFSASANKNVALDPRQPYQVENINPLLCNAGAHPCQGVHGVLLSSRLQVGFPFVQHVQFLSVLFSAGSSLIVGDSETQEQEPSYNHKINFAVSFP